MEASSKTRRLKLGIHASGPEAQIKINIMITITIKMKTAYGSSMMHEGFGMETGSPTDSRLPV
jgi:hypothetical protein